MFVSTQPARRRIAIAAAGFAGLMAFATAQTAAVQQIQLKLAHFLPTANGMHKDFVEPWSRQLEACSHNKVKITIYPAGTQLANIDRLYDEVNSGVVDIALGLAGIPAGRPNRLRLMELSFMVKTANAASRTLWDLHTLIKPDFPHLKILALFATNTGGIHMTPSACATSRISKYAHPFPLRSGQEHAHLSRRGAGRAAAGRGL